MLKIYRQFLQSQNLPILCVRSMGKMDQFKWKPHKKKPNRNPKLAVILKEDMENLGIKGQMVNVERGYARNFLVPKNIAAYATQENMKLYLSKDTNTSEKTEASIPGKFKRFLDRTHLKIERKEGITFEINEHHVALEYKRQYQLHVPAQCIKFREPMRSFGEYTVDVAVRDAVVTPMKVTVLAWKPRIPPRFQKALELESENKEPEQASAK